MAPPKDGGRRDGVGKHREHIHNTCIHSCVTCTNSHALFPLPMSAMCPCIHLFVWCVLFPFVGALCCGCTHVPRVTHSIIMCWPLCVSCSMCPCRVTGDPASQLRLRVVGSSPRSFRISFVVGLCCRWLSGRVPSLRVCSCIEQIRFRALALCASQCAVG